MVTIGNETSGQRRRFLTPTDEASLRRTEIFPNRPEAPTQLY